MDVDFLPHAFHMQSLKSGHLYSLRNVAYKKIEFLVFSRKIQKIKKKLDGHQPPIACYTQAKFEIHVLC